LKSLVISPPAATSLHTLGVLFHRRVFEKVGLWDETLYVEDMDFFLRAAWAGCCFGYCASSPLGFVRVRTGQKTRDPAAMAWGIEAVWHKALGYVSTEPYRALILERLARKRFEIAKNRMNLTRCRALSMVWAARRICPAEVSLRDYAIGCGLIMMPRADAVARSVRSLRMVDR